MSWGSLMSFRVGSTRPSKDAQGEHNLEGKEGIQDSDIQRILKAIGEKKKFNPSQVLHDIWYYFGVYARHSSIHGIRYMIETNSRRWHKASWIVLFLMLYITDFLWVAEFVNEFQEYAIVTNVKRKQGLGEVTYPLVTICNLNRYEKSYWLERDIDSEREIQDIVKVITGTLQNENILPISTQKKLGWKKRNEEQDFFNSFPFTARQSCKDLMLRIEYSGKVLLWKDINRTDFDDNHKGPYWESTDYGFCCSFHPFLDFGIPENNMSRLDEINSLEPGIFFDQRHQLEFLLDIEAFNYGFKGIRSEGVIVSIHNSREKPLVTFSGLTLQKDSNTLVTFKTTIVRYSPVALNTEPTNRKCLTPKEAELKYLRSGNRTYDFRMEGCAFNAAFQKVETTCRCTPLTSASGLEKNPFPLCAGPKLGCQAKIVANVFRNRSSWEVQRYDKITATESPSNCFDRCDVDLMEVIAIPKVFSLTRISKDEENIYEIVAEKLITDTCERPFRKKALEKWYPEICDVLKKNVAYGFNPSYDFNDIAWLWNMLHSNNSDHLMDVLKSHSLLQSYRKGNLLKLRVAVSSPQITTMDYDLKLQAMDLIGEIGGIIGIVNGISIISLFEICFHCCALGYGRSEEVPAEQVSDD